MKMLLSSRITNTRYVRFLVHHQVETRGRYRRRSVGLSPEGVTVPPEGVTVPPEGVTVPPEGVTVPPEGVTVPPEGVTVPPEGVTVRPVGAGTPSPSAWPPSPCTAGSPTRDPRAWGTPACIRRRRCSPTRRRAR